VRWDDVTEPTASDHYRVQVAYEKVGRAKKVMRACWTFFLFTVPYVPSGTFPYDNEVKRVSRVRLLRNWDDRVMVEYQYNVMSEAHTHARDLVERLQRSSVPEIDRELGIGLAGPSSS
jgi:hypothetical protein